MKKKGFTIIELLITMVIMGTLSSTLIPRIGDAKEKTNETMSKVNQNKQYACELGLDDICDSSAGGGAQNLGNGVHHIGTDITVCREGNCITMQDKNLGATKAGTTCNSTDTGACGYHYQWGNNYGFEMGCLTHQCSDSVTSNAITGAISTAGYGPQNYFNNGIFRKITSSPYDWSSPGNDNLRGGGEDGQANNWGYPMENSTDRKGPCDVGYHIPSAGEWSKLLEYWVANYKQAGNNFSSFINNSTAVTQFRNDFKIPLAGYRFDNSAKVFFSGRARFWSSTPFFRAGRGTFTKPANFAYYIYMESNSIENLTDSRSYGCSIRCFKN